jgi:glyoxylase-like metal-dependent hydrolase (beta-lactamase superfamily II)
MVVLEALRAKHGDALLLHYGTKKTPRLAVIDGGPSGVYGDALRPRLMEIREERRLADQQSLPIELLLVSHLDADHITGVLELMRALKDERQSKRPLRWKIARFWHNAFDDLTGNDELSVTGGGSALAPASLGDALEPEGSALLASVAQGRELRDLVSFFTLEGNPPFGSVVRAGDAEPIDLPDLELSVIGPRQKELEKLQKDWNEKIKPLLVKEGKAAKAGLAAYVDRSVYNLSSIVVLARVGGKAKAGGKTKTGGTTILLTGDARGDSTLAALRTAGLLKEAPLEVDVLKLPHHGSDRNVDQDYFDSIHATHYLISADGKFTNPDVPTLRMIAKSRPDDRFTIWLTNAPSDFADAEVGRQVAKFFEAETKTGRKYGVVYRRPEERSVRIELE